MRWMVASAGGGPSSVAAFDGATAASPPPLRFPMCDVDFVMSHDARHFSPIPVHSPLFPRDHKRSCPGAQARAPRPGCHGRGRCACPAGQSGCCPMSTQRRPSPPPCGARPPPLTAPPVQHTQSTKLRSPDKSTVCKHMQNGHRAAPQVDLLPRLHHSFSHQKPTSRLCNQNPQQSASAAKADPQRPHPRKGFKPYLCLKPAAGRGAAGARAHRRRQPRRWACWGRARGGAPAHAPAR